MKSRAHTVEDVYVKLRRALVQKGWNEADALTRSLLCLLVGRAHEPHMVPEAVPLLPCEHLRTICSLWDEASHGYYGFIVQARIWSEIGGASEIRTFDGMSRVEKEELGKVEARYAERVGLSRGRLVSDPSKLGHFPYVTHMCSYGFGLVGLLVAAFSCRLRECTKGGVGLALASRRAED